MTIKHAPRGLSAHGVTTAAVPAAPRPSTGLSPAEIRQIVLDILG